MATGDKNSNHGTLLFIAFIKTFMLCKYHLHTADNSSRLIVVMGVTLAPAQAPEMEPEKWS